MAKKKLTEEKIFEIKQALKCGLTGYEIAEMTGVSTASVTKVRKELEKGGFNLWHRTNGGYMSSRVYY